MIVDKDHPRQLRNKAGEETRAVTMQEYQSLTQGFGYRDVTDEKKSSKSGKSGSGSSSSSSTES